jgi:hypothetical protein
MGAKLPQDPQPLDRILHFRSAIFSGALPDAETLEFIALSFEKYESAQGALSMDAALGLKNKRSVGNPAAQLALSTRWSAFLITMALYRASNPRLTMAKAAEWAIEDCPEYVNDDDPAELVDTLVRYYRGRKCREWEAGIRAFHESEIKHR